MNTNDPKDLSIEGRRIDEREWQAQERAMREARDGIATVDPMARRYRRVADALRVAPPEMLPADFAAQVARRAEAHATAPVVVPDAPFERALLRGAIAVLGLGSAVVAAMYGRAWIAPTLDLLHLESGVAVNWALALGACVAASWLTDQLRRHRESAAHAA